MRFSKDRKEFDKWTRGLRFDDRLEIDRANYFLNSPASEVDAKSDRLYRSLTWIINRHSLLIFLIIRASEWLLISCVLSIVISKDNIFQEQSAPPITDQARRSAELITLLKVLLPIDCQLSNVILKYDI